jgi:transposase
MNSEPIGKSWLKLFNTLDEAHRRWAASAKALELGYGGISEVSRATGLSRTTISLGIRELQQNEPLGKEPDQIRRKGGGRKAVLDNDVVLKREIETILLETTAGDPMSRLIWTCKSVRTIADELQAKGYEISFKTVNRILHELDYSLQANRKTLSRANDTDRDAQFRHINTLVKRFIRQGQPVISVDTKKKELIGKFKNPGERWLKKGNPEKVEDHDFRSRAKGVAIPYGAYDLQRNEGFVNIGVTSDTAEFAVNSIKQWWNYFGRKHYPGAENILICADGGGSNGSRNRLWKLSLQQFSQRAGLAVTVCHYPPGTSKWNKIEHRMFSYISLNWKGRPLESYETIVNLISNTTTKKGLKIKAKIDANNYSKGKKVSDEEFSEINIKFDKKLPAWNYSIRPT